MLNLLLNTIGGMIKSDVKRAGTYPAIPAIKTESNNIIIKIIFFTRNWIDSLVSSLFDFLRAMLKIWDMIMPYDKINSPNSIKCGNNMKPNVPIVTMYLKYKYQCLRMSENRLLPLEAALIASLLLI